jgi:hypothetical protein
MGGDKKRYLKKLAGLKEMMAYGALKYRMTLLS